MKRVLFTIAVLMLFAGLNSSLNAASFKAGTARTDITPPKVVSLWGQFHMRLSTKPETPLTANIVALESVDKDGKPDSAVFVSCDLLQISEPLLAKVQEKTVKKDSTIKPEKIVLNGTHTHTAPVISTTYSSSMPNNPDIITIDETINFLSDRISDAIVKAWQSRRPAKMAFGLDFANVAHQRRVVYDNGTSVMYGKSDVPAFRTFESLEDQDINTLFFYEKGAKEDKLMAVVINVSCPSQVVEGRSAINADYWLPVREIMAKRFGNDVVVLGWCGAAGDLSPRPPFRKEAYARMSRLRGLNEMQEIARKLDRAVAATFDAVKDTRTDNIVFGHKTETLNLPLRKVTEAEYASAKKEYDNIMARAAAEPKKKMSEIAFMAYGWHKSVLDRYERLKKDPKASYATPIHVIRLGDAAICTNQFELYTDYGIQMKSWSPAVQTFVVQLVGNGTYLPTERAVRGGGYSAVIQSNVVGPEGGQILVNETVKLLKQLWNK